MQKESDFRETEQISGKWSAIEAMGRKLVSKWKARGGKEIGRRVITGPSECLSKLRTEKYLLNSV